MEIRITPSTTIALLQPLRKAGVMGLGQGIIFAEMSDRWSIGDPASTFPVAATVAPVDGAYPAGLEEAGNEASDAPPEGPSGLEPTDFEDEQPWLIPRVAAGHMEDPEKGAHSEESEKGPEETSVRASADQPPMQNDIGSGATRIKPISVTLLWQKDSGFGAFSEERQVSDASSEYPREKLATPAALLSGRVSERMAAQDPAGQRLHADRSVAGTAAMNERRVPLSVDVRQPILSQSAIAIDSNPGLASTEAMRNSGVEMGFPPQQITKATVLEDETAASPVFSDAALYARSKIETADGAWRSASNATVHQSPDKFSLFQQRNLSDSIHTKNQTADLRSVLVMDDQPETVRTTYGTAQTSRSAQLRGPNDSALEPVGASDVERLSNYHTSSTGSSSQFKTAIAGENERFIVSDSEKSGAYLASGLVSQKTASNPTVSSINSAKQSEASTAPWITGRSRPDLQHQVDEDLLAAVVGHDSPPRQPTSPSAAASTVSTPPPPVTRQIAEMISLSPFRTGETELLLAPEELGRVHFAFSQTESGLSVTVAADRPETLAMLRRNAEMLSTELAQAGIGDALIGFREGHGSAPGDGVRAPTFGEVQS
ncbi:flagellar hook-length control protein FliK [Paracoccus sediminicola]|uniref:flagellar hook-length control protein FliK n=1 Tax=Paracoccus sediminicola TaxID=3017783 RepID=UPI0022F08629|nr:flagellar hook-length control protein FliK [Paracoccus sediminicola]WBU56880.1 flagellar hook-length control protein FliK [Paracoccus sediminicola]